MSPFVSRWPFCGPLSHFCFLCLSLLFFFLPSLLPVSHVNFWFLLFVFVGLLFLSRCSFTFFCFSVCCLVFFESQSYSCSFASCCIVVVVVCLCCFGVLLFFEFLLPIKNISQTFGNSENPQNKQCRKTDILTRTISTSVFTNIVFVSFLVFL